MMREPRLLSPPARVAARATLVLALGALVAAAPVTAQENPDFLFNRPKVSLGLFGGWASPSAGSEVFDFTRQHLTIEQRAFDAPAFGAELAVLVSERVDVALAVSHASRKVHSEMRDWVEEVNGEDVPIEQTTRFRRIPVTLSAKGYLWDRGRTVSRFAWVPVAKWSPYVGAGVGWMWYSFEQEGDFVDFATQDIFFDELTAEDASPTAHVLAGAQLFLSPRLVLSGEGRYSWAKARMGGEDFTDFDDIDLSGFQVTAGLSVRF